jgi:hypothetical protein
VLAQLVEDLLHLERGGQRLDEHGRLDRPVVEAELLLGEGEHLGPQARLEVGLHLGQVEVRSRALLQQPPGVAQQVEPGVDEGARHRLAVDAHVLLDQVPAAGAHEQSGDVVAQLVLAPVVARERDRPFDRVGEIDLALDDVRPRRRQRVLEVGHEPARAGVQRVDDHLAVDRPGDLDAAVLQVGRCGGHAPVALADLPGAGQEVERLARGDARAALAARVEELAPARLEALVQPGEEGEGLVGEDAGGRRGGEDVDGHGFLPWIEAASSSIG